MTLVFLKSQLIRLPSKPEVSALKMFLKEIQKIYFISDAIENKLENHASSLDKIDDILELANRTQSIVDGINVTHQEIKGMFVYENYLIVQIYMNEFCLI